MLLTFLHPSLPEVFRRSHNQVFASFSTSHALEITFSLLSLWLSCQVFELVELLLQKPLIFMTMKQKCIGKHKCLDKTHAISSLRCANMTI